MLSPPPPSEPDTLSESLPLGLANSARQLSAASDLLTAEPTRPARVACRAAVAGVVTRHKYACVLSDLCRRFGADAASSPGRATVTCCMFS